MDELKKEVMNELDEAVAPVEAVEAAAEAAAEVAEEKVEATVEVAEEKIEAAAIAAEQEIEAAAEAAVEKAEAAAKPVEEKKEAGESMDDYANELEASFRKIEEGDKLTGTVISVTDDEILVDLGYYTDGIIRLGEAGDAQNISLKNLAEEGQKITATVVSKDDGAGHILLSTKEAAQMMAWERLNELAKTGANVTVTITDTTKAGVITTLEGVRAFIPASKLALGYVEEADLKDWVGKTIDVRVIEAQEDGKKLVLSAREILREKQKEERKSKISNVEIGLVTEGKVETIKPYGAFVRFGDGLSGLVHVSQISVKRIKDPSEVLKEGDTVKVKVIANKDGKISLSMKALEDAPAQEAYEERVQIPKSEKLTTSLGDLIAKLNLKGN